MEALVDARRGLVGLDLRHQPHDAGVSMFSRPTRAAIGDRLHAGVLTGPRAVPDNHPIRAIGSVLDLSWVHSKLARFYAKIRRPSIDPELMAFTA